MRYKTRFTSQARKDIKKISKELYDLTYSKSIASRKVGKIRKAISDLSDFPYKCPIYEVEPLNGKGLHFLTIENYNVLYRIIENTYTIEIITIYHGRTDPNKVMVQ